MSLCYVHDRWAQNYKTKILRNPNIFSSSQIPVKKIEYGNPSNIVCIFKFLSLIKNHVRTKETFMQNEPH